MDSVVAWPWDYGVYSNSTEQFQETLNLYISNTTQVNLLCDYYYSVDDFPVYRNHSSVSSAFYTLNSDVCSVCPSLMLAEQIISNSDTEAYVYYFRGTEYPYYAGTYANEH